MDGYILVMYFTGRYWLTLAPSKLQSSPEVSPTDRFLDGMFPDKTFFPT